MNILKRIIFIVLFLVVATAISEACTSAIISASANPYGRPILWKHRDTSNIDNKVEYVPASASGFGYVALFNASDKKLKEAWMGMNDAGFAIMNTASYNLKDDKVASSKMDKEGFVMTIALRECKTVDDFGKLLNRLPRPMGVEANFGVIDAQGNGAYFETNNHSYTRYDLKDAEGGVMIRTNYSMSGRKNEGYGFARYLTAEKLLSPHISNRSVTPELLTEEISRGFYHEMLGRDFSCDRWVIDQDFIPRYKSTATVAIEGCYPQQDLKNVNSDFVRREYIMWTGLGYPPCAETIGVRLGREGVNEDLRGLMPDGHSKLADRAKEMRAKVFPLKAGNGEKYIDMHVLYNETGSGFAQQMKAKSLENYERERRIRDKGK